jgi:hypothetical protein
LLACARRDGARAAAEMQRRHLEAAVTLESPPVPGGGGGAVNVAYEAVREERVMQVVAQTHKEQDCAQREGQGSTGAAAVPPPPLLQAAAAAVTTEVERRLERWRAQLAGCKMPSPAAEPSLGAAPGSAGSVKLLSGADRRVATWPGIFTFPRS